MVVTVGVDVGKASLDIPISEGPVIRFDNTVKGIGKLLKHLKAQDVTVAACEATGGYERLLVSQLRKTEIAIHVAHPSRVRAFAKASGYEAKTGPRDAQVLSRYGQVFPDKRTPHRELGPDREALRDLPSRRRQFVRQRVQEKGRLDKGITSIVQRSTKRHIAWLEKEIARLDVEYQGTLEKCIPFADRATLYRTVPGVGPLTSATLVTYLPELGCRDSRSLTSLAGLAP